MAHSFYKMINAVLKHQLSLHHEHSPRTPEIILSATNILYNGILLHRWCIDEMGPRHKMWEVIRKKLREFANKGLRVVTILWPPEWGESPRINTSGWAYRVPIADKTARRGMRRWRKWLLRVLMMHGIPSDVRLHAVSVGGL